MTSACPERPSMVEHSAATLLLAAVAAAPPQDCSAVAAFSPTSPESSCRATFTISQSSIWSCIASASPDTSLTRLSSGSM
jgi:hypothetical protein